MSDEKENYTHIFDSLVSETNPEDFCYCSDGYGGRYFSCDCPKDPRVFATKVEVRVEGNPIKFVPSDAKYIVRVFQGARYESTADEPFDEGNFVVEFVLESTVQPVDLDGSNNKIVKEYLSKLDPVFFKTGKFRAPKPIQSYVAAFQTLVANILNPPPPREKGECDHVRKKGKKYAGESKAINKASRN